MNCRNDCHHGLIGFNPHRSVSGEISLPQISRRHFLGAAFAGALYIPVLRLDGSLANNWNSGLVRPPGAMPEPDFLSRCLKCGQCMRICPTNVIQPALFEGGLEGIWTPVLNFRTGTSGCQLNCIACGNVCPTAAIRPISIEEKRGEGDFLENGPIRIGMAFVDHGRCLPWSMDLPCIVCQENCPVSPKAIFTRTVFQDLRGLEILKIASVSPDTVTLQQKFLPLARYATGDYYCRAHNFESPRKILSHSGDSLTLSTDSAWKVMPEVGDSVAIAVKLQHPYVDPSRCIGCGVCEHECPVKGLRAIRVTGENETRNREHQLLLRRPEA
jgi:ferredoxin